MTETPTPPEKEKIMHQSFSVLSRAVWLFALTALLSVAANAQFQASIQGTVADAAGALIPQAKVTLSSKETGRDLQTVTSGDGFYRFTALAPGSYKLTVEHSGFKRKELENITVSAEATQGVDRSEEHTSEL